MTVGDEKAVDRLVGEMRELQAERDRLVGQLKEVIEQRNAAFNREDDALILAVRLNSFAEHARSCASLVQPSRMPGSPCDCGLHELLSKVKDSPFYKHGTVSGKPPRKVVAEGYDGEEIAREVASWLKEKDPSRRNARPVQIGDRVRHPSGLIGEVLSLGSEDAWVTVQPAPVNQDTEQFWKLSQLQVVSPLLTKDKIP